jgi:hypothetical protein
VYEAFRDGRNHPAAERGTTFVSALLVDMLHLFAALAEKERALISRRTKEALAAAKARGVKLGGLRSSGIANQKAAADFAEGLRPVFAELADLSARAAAEELNRRSIKTAAGASWHAAQVVRVRERLRFWPRKSGDAQKELPTAYHS